jgi:hypothetical protein
MLASLLFSREPKMANFENVQYAIHHPESYILINVLELQEQDCLIYGTTDAFQEEHLLNTMMRNVSEPDKIVIVYGKHNHDKKLKEKVIQIEKLGILDVYMYVGGLFEWLLLQDIYGDDAFPTTKHVLDILKYKPPRIKI